MDTELERFKTDIDLRAFAESLGFELDARESWRGSAVMKRGQQDKIIVTKGNDGHYVYVSVKADHGGTIIDLAKRYLNGNLGHVRKTLRQWRGGTLSSPPQRFWPDLEKTPKDLTRVAQEWHRAMPYSRHAWLEDERRILPALPASTRFAGRLRIDARANVLFAHSDAEGRLCGFEKKNWGFTGFAAGGFKGLGRSNDFDGDVCVVFCEAFIDLLSYAALFPDETARYRSFGGGLSPGQPELIRADILALPRGSLVIAATDGDDAGERFAETIASLCEGYDFKAHRPDGGDWNDVLKAPLLPTALQTNDP